MLYRIFFRFFWNTYDNLGGWMLLSAVGFFLCLPVVTAPAAWGALLGAAARSDREEAISLSQFREDFRRFGRRSTLMGLLLLAGVGLCTVNVIFYSVSPLAAHLGPFALIAIRLLFIWIALFWFICVQIGWAFMVMQDLAVKKALKRGFMVMGAHPLVALTVLSWGVFVAILLWVSVLGAILMLGALLANLAMGVAAGTVEHYEEIEDRRERERLKSEGARSWNELRALDERAAARQRRYDRGWKDIVRPWEMR